MQWLLLFITIWGSEGSMERRESLFKMHVFDCRTPIFINKYHLPEEVSE